MKNKTLRILSLGLAVTTALSTSTPVLAYDVDEHDNSIESVEYQNTADEDFKDATNVFAQLGSEYKVTIPKVIVLSGTTKDARYYVKVVGDIAGDESVNVVPDSTFLLNAKNKDAQTAAINQDRTSWTYSKLGTDANGTIKADGITAGDWKGTFNFNIDLTKVLADIVLPATDDPTFSITVEAGENKKLVSTSAEVESFTSDNEDVVKVNPDGTFVTVGAGTATLTIVDKDGNVRKVPVVVEKTDNIVAEIPSDTNTGIRIEEGESKKINLASNNTIDLKDVTFESSDPEVLTVDSEGNVTALKKGVATVTIKSANSVPKTITINVDKEGEVSLPETGTVNYTFTSGDARQLVADSESTFESSNPEVVEVDEDGNIVAKNVGTTVITVTDKEGNTKQVEITVNPTDNIVPSIDGVKSDEIRLETGDNKKLNIASSNSMDVSNAVFESSDPEVLTVDSEGNITALKEGTATITISSPNSLPKTVTITVDKEGVVNIPEENAKISFMPGQEKKLVDETLGENVSYESSNPEVVEIDESGNIVAKNVGTTTVTVKGEDGKTKTVTVTVNPVDNIVASIDEDTDSNVRLEVGDNKQFSVVSNNTMQLKDVTYTSSNPEVLTVDSKGNVVALKEGTATITIKSSNSLPKTVTINVDKVGQVSVPNSIKTVPTVVIEAGSEKAFASKENEDNTFVSSNSDVVEIDKDGNFIAKNVGTTTITIKDQNGKTKKVEITVKPTDNIVASADGKASDSFNVKATDSKSINLASSNTMQLKDVTFESSDSSIATVDNNGNVTALKEGTVTVTIKSANSVPKTVTIVVGHKEAAAVKENEVAATCTKDGSYDEVVYCASGDGYEFSRVKKIVAATGHKYVEGKCTVCGDTLPALSVSASGYTGTYDGKAHSISVTSSGNTIQYSTDNKTWSNTNPSYTNAGTYTVYYKVSKDTYKTVTGSANVVINKANSAVKAAPTAKSLTYNGSAQQLINAGSATNGTIQYKLGTGSYNTAIPTATNAGTYTVYYKVVGNTNYNDVAEKSFTITIAKATPSVTAPTAKSLTYNGSAQALINAGKTNAETLQYSTDNKTWGTTIPTGTNAGSYTVYYRVVGNTNYNDIAAKSVSVSVAKKAGYINTKPTAKSLTYNGSAQALANAGSNASGTIQYKLNNGSWQNSVPTATNAGTYTVYYQVLASTNYNAVSAGSFNVTISKATPTYTAPKAVTTSKRRYTGKALTLLKGGSSDFGTFEYSMDGKTWSTTIPTATNAGKYTIYYRCNSNNNNYSNIPSTAISVELVKAIDSPLQWGGSWEVSMAARTINGVAANYTAGSNRIASIYANEYNANNITVSCNDSRRIYAKMVKGKQSDYADVVFPLGTTAIDGFESTVTVTWPETANHEKGSRTYTIKFR